MELVLSQDLEKCIPQEIGFNYDELKAQLAESLDRYNKLVVTEDAIQPAKKDRAALNTLYKAIEDKRKAVKKACLAPYETFEVKAKELTGMIQQPIDAIDRQVKSFEDQKRQEKYKAITHFHTTNIGDLSDLVPLDKILPSKWANAGTTLISVTQEIAESIQKIRNDLGIIEKMSAEFSQQMTDAYLKTLDMSAALAEKNRLEEQQQILAARKVEQERQREAERQAAIDIIPEEEIPVLSSSEPVVIDDVGETAVQKATKTIDVRFYDTTAAFRQEMKVLTEKHGIKYGGIK